MLRFSSFHVDHSSALPYVLSKTNFAGRVMMTHATKVRAFRVRIGCHKLT